MITSGHLLAALLVGGTASRAAAAFSVSMMAASSNNHNHHLSSSHLSANQRKLAAMSMPRKWVPLASIDDLDSSRPNQLEYMGCLYVANKNSDPNDPTKWTVMDDHAIERKDDSTQHLDNATATRHVDVVKDGCYHGGTKQDRTVYPTRVFRNVLFAWLWPEGCLSYDFSDWSNSEHVTPLAVVTGHDDKQLIHSLATPLTLPPNQRRPRSTVMTTGRRHTLLVLGISMAVLDFVVGQMAIVACALLCIILTATSHTSDAVTAGGIAIGRRHTMLVLGISAAVLDHKVGQAAFIGCLMLLVVLGMIHDSLGQRDDEKNN